MRNLVLALVFMSSLAQAKVESNYTLTPSEGQNEFTPGVNFVVGTVEYKNNLGDTKIVGANLNASYFYGFTDNLSAGVAIDYSSIRAEHNQPNTNTQTSKGKGLGDPVISVKGNVDVNNLSLYYSVGYGIAAQKNKYNTDSDEYSMASGQNSYRLAAGLAIPVNDYTIGAIINYQKNLKGKGTRTTSGVDTEFDIKEDTSHVAKLYMEFQKQYHLTGAFIHQRYSDLYHGLEFSARFDMTAATSENASHSEIIPQVTSLVMKHPDDIGAERSTAVYIGATFRYVF